MADDDEIDLLLAINNQEIFELRQFPRKFYKFKNAFNIPDKKFMKHFRLNKELVESLIEMVRPYTQEATRASALRFESKVFIALHFFATGGYQLPVGSSDMISASQTSVSRSIHEVVDILNRPELLNQFIRFPRNLQELNQIRQQFFDKFGMPGIIGCIDCTHVAIVPPRNDVAPENVFVNRKHYHSINTQLICDAHMKILHVNARFPGSTNDKFIWQNCNIEPILREIYNRGQEGYFLLGDSGYVLRPWLLIPLENPLTDAEEMYNQEQRRIRSLIERCIGVLKMPFRCLLKHRVLHYSPTTASKIINACVILHNICIDANIELNIEELDFGIFENDPQDGIQQQARDPYILAGRQMQRRIIHIFEVQHI